MKQFMRYLAAGSVNTLVAYLTVILLTEILNMQLLISNLTGYLLGICCSYLLNRYYVFRLKGTKDMKSLSLFIMVFLLAYGANISALLLFSHIMKLSTYLSQFAAMGIYSIVFYFLCREYVFIKKSN